MAIAEDNWQTKLGTVRERIAFLWSNELLSDVKFVVPVSNGESESKKEIPAHKFVLAISSPVFYAMFYGQMTETTDSIELPDCEYESLLELFRYMYSDEVNLKGSNVMRVLYLAKKYMVPSLADKCTEYLRANLKASNVFSILPHSQKFADKDLEDRCWKVIEMDTEEAVTSDEFVTLERSLVESVVKREYLHVKEIDLFKAVDRWAIKECERQGMTPEGEVKRKLIGKTILEEIRFPLMSEKEFISVVPDCNILTTKEIVDMVKHYNNVLTSPLQFSVAPRVKRCIMGPATSFHECRRFESYSFDDPLFLKPRDKRDRICFAVNKSIYLYGVQLFGREGASYTGSVHLNDTADDSCIVKTSGTYASKVKDHLTCYYAFGVLFDQPVFLRQYTCYEIVSSFIGPPSWFGKKGKSAVDCGGVVFTFSSSKRKENNGSDVSGGQFPALLFTT